MNLGNTVESKKRRVEMWGGVSVRQSSHQKRGVTPGKGENVSVVRWKTGPDMDTHPSRIDERLIGFLEKREVKKGSAGAPLRGGAIFEGPRSGFGKSRV